MIPIGASNAGRRRCLVGTVLLACVLVIRSANADEALARAHFAKGVALYDKKQFSAALEEFKAAYAEKPSPGIKQNIALCLVGLNQAVAAARAFDEALDEGHGTLKPETHDAIEHELASLAQRVATLSLVVEDKETRRPVENGTVTIAGEGGTETVVPASALRRAIRLSPGIYVIRAHAEGYVDPPEKKLSLLAGSPVDAAFEVSKTANVTLHPSVADAVVRVDGKDVGRGVWTGKLAAGSHRVEVSSPGWQTTTVDVVVAPGTPAEYPITLRRPPEMPDAYRASTPSVTGPLPVKRWYVALHVAAESESLNPSKALGEASDSHDRTFSDVGFGGRAGYRFSRFFSGEIYGAFGSPNASYRIRENDVSETSTKVTYWQVAPSLRFSTVGRLRATTAVGFGFHHTSVESIGGQSQIPSSVEGSGGSAVGLFDLGGQLDVGSFWLEAAFTANIFGVGSVRADDGSPLLGGWAQTRVGARLSFGIPLF